MQNNVPRKLHEPAIRKIKTTEPYKPVLLYRSQTGKTNYGMKILLVGDLSLVHCGYLSKAIHDVQCKARHAGQELEIFVADEKRSRFETFHQDHLNATNGRVLFSAIGPDDAGS